jgi:hypothetical protein
MISTYRAHANECIAIMLSLKHSQEYIFPPELIQMIMKLYWSLWSTPVLVLFTADFYCHCKNLSEIWYPQPLGRLPKGESILCKLTEMYPGLRFVNAPHNKAIRLEHPDIYPLRINHYVNWYPMIQLIPGPLWDHAILYPKLGITLVDGVQVFDGIWEDHVSLDDAEPNTHRTFLLSHPKYDATKVDDYVQWFTESLNNPKFIAAQNKLL